MKNNYDFSKAIKNPYYEHISKHGYKVTVYDHDGPDRKILREEFISPEEVAERNRIRAEHTKEYLESRRVQG